jgi:hypothetical protein
MSPPTYTVILDADDDNLDDAGENITSDVLRLEWRLGLAVPYDSVAAPIAARITLRNPSRAYSPEVAANLIPGKQIRILSDDGLTIRTHFTGLITHIEPMPGDWGERLAVIHAGGPEAQLAQNRVRLPPQVNKRADEVIAAVLDSLPLRRPKLAGYWLLDTASHAELGTNTRLAEDYPRTLETGISTFAYTADTWVDGLPAVEAIRQMVEAERGRFFVDRSGALVFYNRHHTLSIAVAVAAIAANMEGMDYSYGAEVVNRVGVTLLPRSIGTPNTVLWSLESAQRLAPGETGVRQIIARYRDADNRPIGALSIIPPLSGVDFHANTQPDGSGGDRTSQVQVILTESAMSAAVLTLRNNGADSVYLLPGMGIRGTPLAQGDLVTLDHTDWLGVSLYGLHHRSFDLPALSSLEEADDLARFELARRKDPRGLVRGLQVSGTIHLTQILTRTLFDRITVSETQTGHSADYFIVAEEHTVDLGGARHQVSWLLEPAAANTFWLVGTSHLDTETILAY